MMSKSSTYKTKKLECLFTCQPRSPPSLLDELRLEVSLVLNLEVRNLEVLSARDYLKDFSNTLDIPNDNLEKELSLFSVKR